MTHFPEILEVRNCFQALASRADNKRVPAQRRRGTGRDDKEHYGTG